MTDKERAYVEAHENDESSLKELSLKLFRKELVKKLNRKGYAVSKKEIAADGEREGVYLNAGEPPFYFYVPTSSDFEAWKNGEKSALKVYGKSKNKNAQHEGKTFVKCVKDVLKEEGRYVEPAEERGEDELDR
ncbi:MAG: hypothetical protein K6F00_09250 [Lachnospiraceae bacterium]|nr:hypothetical protein [Lachnospiraceae bacterium]